MDSLFTEEERRLARAAVETAEAAAHELSFLADDDPASWAALQRLMATMDRVRRASGAELEDAGPACGP